MIKKMLVLWLAAWTIGLTPGWAKDSRMNDASASETLTVKEFPSNRFFRIRFEKPNGVDMRENAMPRAVIQQLEKSGKHARPHGDATWVTYWAMMKDGTLNTMDVQNNPDHAILNVEELNKTFEGVHGSGQHYVWGKDGRLYIGSLRPGARELNPQTVFALRANTANADIPEIHAQKGQIVLSVVNAKDPNGAGLYFYVADFLTGPQ